MSDAIFSTVRLGDVASIAKDSVSPGRSTLSEVRLFSLPAFDRGEPERVSPDEVKSNKLRIRPGDILLTKLNPHIPRTWMPSIQPQEEAWCSTEFLPVRPSHADGDYLFQVLRSPTFYDDLRALVTGTTGSHQRVSPEDVLDLRIPLPHLDEQRRIAAVLGAFDDLIETNLWSWARVRDISGAMYAEALQRAEGEQTLGSVSRVSESKTKPGVGGIRYVDIAAMGDGHIEIPDAIDWEDAPSRARMLATDGATLWSTVRPNRRAHGLLVESPDDLVVSTGIAVIEPDGVGPAELFAACDRPEFVDHLLARASGSAYPAVRSSDFRTVPIPRLRPEDSEQFESVSWPLWKDAHAGLLDNERLTRARDELLPLLMSGRVRVDDVEGMV